ncbi:Helix-turn-helix [Streptomyces sp. MnatMP-M17]|nr:Helix-turn-helix [Streptomyces sp. MnatMP-M17]
MIRPMATDSPRFEASALRPGDGEEPTGSLDFAARFRRVISVIYPKDLGRPWRDSEIAEGTGLSGTYIGNLRKGTQKPSLENAVKIAKFFGVPLNYFSDSATARAVERDLRKIEALRDARVERIAMRAAGLPPAMQDAALTVVEQLRKAVGLPEAPEGAETPEGDGASGAAGAPGTADPSEAPRASEAPEA